jgi:2-oxoglutarate ferredoxin oxidoreductase subunit gamma
VERSDLKAVYVPCAEIAYKVGNPKVGNMVMLGAYVGATGVLKPDTIREMIREMFTGPKAKLQELNFRALDEGMACVC